MNKSLILSLIFISLFLVMSCEPVTMDVSDDTETVDTNTYLEIINNSSVPFWAVYCTPTTDTSWGTDLLGNSVISAGDSMKFVITPGTVDIRVDTQNTYGESNGAWQATGVVIEDRETYSKTLYDS